MTNGLEDLVTSLQVFSDILEREGVDIEDFDYVEFLTDTIPALGERIERETLEMTFRRFRELDPNNASRMAGWFTNDLGIGVEDDD